MFLLVRKSVLLSIVKFIYIYICLVISRIEDI